MSAPRSAGVASRQGPRNAGCAADTASVDLAPSAAGDVGDHSSVEGSRNFEAAPPVARARLSGDVWPLPVHDVDRH